MSWRYLAVDIDAYSGEQVVIDPELPLTDVSITRTRNGGQELNAKIVAPPARLRDEFGDSRIRRWRTAIFADDGDQLYGGIVDEGSILEGPEWTIETIGFAAYPNGQPAQGSWSATDIDAFDAFRRAWSDLQALAGGKLGVQVDQHKSGVKIGRKVAQGEYDTVNGPLAFEYEPVQLRWYETNDVGQWLSDLADGVGFEFWEEHRLTEQDELQHRIRLAYPRRGSRREDVRFVVGDNVKMPDLKSLEYASGIMVLGAGEGSAMIRAESYRSGEDRIRRIVLSDEKTARTKAAARTAAEAELRTLTGEYSTDSIIALSGYRDTLGVLDLGDEALLVIPVGESDVIDMWVTIDSITERPGSDEPLEFSVVRSDMISG